MTPAPSGPLHRRRPHLGNRRSRCRPAGSHNLAQLSQCQVTSATALPRCEPQQLIPAPATPRSTCRNRCQPPGQAPPGYLSPGKHPDSHPRPSIRVRTAQSNPSRSPLPLVAKGQQARPMLRRRSPLHRRGTRTSRAEHHTTSPGHRLAVAPRSPSNRRDVHPGAAAKALPPFTRYRHLPIAI